MADVPILFDRPIPEGQVSAPYPTCHHPLLGAITITSGFMEPHGHGFKRAARKAIHADGSIRVCPPGPYNIGIDYTCGFGSKVICLYSGVVVQAGFEGGYGHRLHVRLDQPFVHQGRNYPCFQAYAHCLRLLKGVGQRVSQGEAIAIEAGHGSHGPHDYGSHVDLDTYCVIDGETHHLNPDLLGRGLRPDSAVQPVGVLRRGARGHAVRWLQLCLGLAPDGVFGPGTEAALKAFQRQQGDLSVDGAAGEHTCLRLGLVDYAIFATAPAFALADPQRADAECFSLDPADPPRPLLANWLRDEGEHWRFELKQPIRGRFNWSLPKRQVAVLRSCSSSLADQGAEVQNGDLQPGPPAQTPGRWHRALMACSTQGCAPATARPEQLASGGVAASHAIMRRDLERLTPRRLATVQSVGARLGVPCELILALASRESHLGALLGQAGCDPGWGDGNQAWGVLQVDRRFHALRGLDDPWSEAHLEQATGILAAYRDQVSRHHPDWPDDAVLKGACVAYNSGVANVRTQAGMNEGTTHNDYGDDVIARAQFCRGRL